MGQKYSQRYTKEVIRRALVANDESHYMTGSCHTLAYAMWLANERQGKLVACMNCLTEPGNETPYSISYGHMVYEDLNGDLWDISGKRADARYEEERLQAHESDNCSWERYNGEEPDEQYSEHELEFKWLEIHPNNLFAFLKDWNATRAIESKELLELLGGEPPEEPSHDQTDMFANKEAHVDTEQSPLSNLWYRNLYHIGFLKSKTPIDEKPKQHALFS